jgi:uncharacterized tellurite resistance protein B-like protein
MIEALRNFVRRLGEPQAHFGDDDARLALAALLVHCTGIDGSVSAVEQAALRDVLARSFRLPPADLEALIADAVAAEREAVDLYRFTSVLKRQMSEAERIRVIESLWEVAYADGKSHEFEDNLVWRIAALLGVTSRDRIARRRAVAENRSAGEGDAG